jgi:hypothetical protein
MNHFKEVVLHAEMIRVLQVGIIWFTHRKKCYFEKCHPILIENRNY